jgi:hypothetical protein
MAVESISRELANRRPATGVVDTRQRGQVIRLAAPYVRKAALVEEAKRLERRGEVAILDPRPAWSDVRRQWEIRARRIKEPRPRWVKPVIVTGCVLSGLSALGVAGLWVYATLAAIPGVVLLGLVLLIFVGAVAMSGKPGARRATQVDVSVRVRVR